MVGGVAMIPAVGVAEIRSRWFTAIIGAVIEILHPFVAAAVRDPEAGKRGAYAKLFGNDRPTFTGLRRH